VLPPTEMAADFASRDDERTETSGWYNESHSFLFSAGKSYNILGWFPGFDTLLTIHLPQQLLSGATKGFPR
jgi:hypothetical protein